ncbi:hypothetical protein RclHR1_05750014 [Rhizophagus clarus]|uniref:Uncharacterized protein n=1 Tax=Rhizophagus clarus TaxID=94130 RepID=A0A2Z6S778_9GLOM|nr:hypothetical protein RclHR1_05750014 [Rhizophagus clarus]
MIKYLVLEWPALIYKENFYNNIRNASICDTSFINKDFNLNGLVKITNPLLRNNIKKYEEILLFEYIINQIIKIDRL